MGKRGVEKQKRGKRRYETPIWANVVLKSRREVNVVMKPQQWANVVLKSRRKVNVVMKPQQWANVVLEAEVAVLLINEMNEYNIHCDVWWHQLLLYYSILYKYLRLNTYSYSI